MQQQLALDGPPVTDTPKPRKAPVSKAVQVAEQAAPPAVHAQSGDAMIMLVERLMRDPNIDPERIERILDIRAKEEKRTAERAFNEAISAAKGEIPPIVKNRTVDFNSAKGRTTYKHEDLGEIARVVDPILKAHGLSYRFRSQQNGAKLTLTCVVSHSMGHFEENTLEAGEDHSGNKNSIQAIGSTATYLQRYTLKLALGLAASNDTDGNIPGPAQTAISEVQYKELAALITETGTDLDKFLAFGNVESLSDITTANFASAKAMLMAKKAKMASDQKAATQ